MANTLSRIASYFGTWLGGQRSLENPSTSLNAPDDWLHESFGGESTASGTRVNAEIALKYAPWWRGINLISRDVGKLPLVVYKRNGPGKEPDKSHMSYQLLRYRANNELLSAFTFKQTLQSHAMSYGNGYAWILRNGAAVPLELIVLNPLECWPFRENGRLWYAVRVGMSLRRVNPTEIFHLKGLSPDGLVGYSVYQKAKESIGEGRAAQEYGSRFFRNAARPSVVIEVPGTMTDAAQRAFLAAWEKMHTGLESSHRTAILTSGATLKPFSTNARDSQMHEIRKFNLVDIANFIGVPVHKVGGEGRTAFASLEQENQAYLDESLDPWLVCWEFEAREKLLTEDQKNNDTHVIEFTRNALVRADITSRFNAYQIGIRSGIVCRDEVRAKENMNPLPDGEGQKFFAPLELQVIGDNQPPEIPNVSAMLAITQAVIDGSVPHESAKAMLAASFPLLSATQISQIVDPLVVSAPEPPDEPATPDVESDTEDDIEPIDEPATEPATQRSSPSPETVRQVLVDAVRRACNHLQIHAIKRAKRAGNFLNDMETEREQDMQRVAEIVTAPARLCLELRGEFGEFTVVPTLIMGCLLDEILLAAEAAHNRDELVSAVETRMTDMTATLPERLADQLLNEGVV